MAICGNGLEDARKIGGAEPSRISVEPDFAIVLLIFTACSESVVPSVQSDLRTHASRFEVDNAPPRRYHLRVLLLPDHRLHGLDRRCLDRVVSGFDKHAAPEDFGNDTSPAASARPV